MSNWDPIKEQCLPIKKPVVVKLAGTHLLAGGTHLWMSSKVYKALVKVLKESYYWDGEKWVGDSALVSVVEPDSPNYKPTET